MTYFAAIDPGEDGALVVLGGKSFSFWKTKEQSEEEICQGLKSLAELPVIMYIEDVRTIFNVRSQTNFALGWSAGWWHGVCDAYRIPVKLVKPKDWQSLITTTPTKQKAPLTASQKVRDLIKKQNKEALKQESLRVANSYFPGANITHDGVADAVCIALYGKKMYESKRI